MQMNNFFLYDSEDCLNRIIIFTTKRNLQLLSTTNFWYADGTFKTVPSLFNQLYTIHGVINNDVLPLVYILMSKRTESSYRKLFFELKTLESSLSPMTIMTDFEKGAINVLKKIIFPPPF